MTTKILATITALIGAVSVFYGLLAALGWELNQPLQDAITALLGLVLVIAGIWFHPSVPVGVTESGPPPTPTTMP